jgi:hypothetical protein
VESLLRRGRDGDLDQAQAAIDMLATVQTEPGFVLYELPLLRMRALLARASDDKEGYRASADKYFVLAQTFEFEGHLSRRPGVVAPPASSRRRALARRSRSRGRSVAHAMTSV